MVRYRFILFISVVVFSGMSLALASDSKYAESDSSETGHQSVIPTISDLFVEAVAAKKSRLPLLIMFGADDCGYCEKLEAEILKPMYISGEYQEKVIMRRVMIDNFDAMRDFKGTTLEAFEFASKYKVTVTPTVMLLDSDGKMLAPKLIGINTVDFYGAYLDEAIDLSYKKLNK
ncbi:MAG: thioredoxin fold domain-containing protein [Gammaproteobacteria bacterium]|nr:thioredoxin fold domain-containing protein [Gammaproteobacteria bacterium]